MTEPLLKVDNLRTYFSTEEGVVRAVDGISFSVNPGERRGVVGESGSGRSVTAMSIMRLIEPPAGEIVTGTIDFRGTNLLELVQGLHFQALPLLSISEMAMVQEKEMIFCCLLTIYSVSLRRDQKYQPYWVGCHLR